MGRFIVVAVLCGSIVACGPRVIRESRFAPQAVQQRLLAFPRVWVAGFVVNSIRDVDLNSETVRLVRAALTMRTGASVVEGEPLTIDTDARFANARFWREHAEERGFPLIVTGTVRLLLAPPQIEQRGRRTIYLATGRVLDVTVMTIDGRTGKLLSTHRLPRRTRDDTRDVPSGLELFVEMMEAGMQDWLAAISDTPVDRAATMRPDDTLARRGRTRCSWRGESCSWSFSSVRQRQHMHNVPR